MEPSISPEPKRSQVYIQNKIKISQCWEEQLTYSFVTRMGRERKTALQDLFSHSLSHVSEILNSIEDKISQERKILSLMEYDFNHQHSSGLRNSGTTELWNPSSYPNAESTFIEDLRKSMTMNDYGYFTAFLSKFAELIYSKDPPHSYVVVNQLNLKAKKYLEDGKLNSLGDTLTRELRMVLSMFPKLTPHLISQRAGLLNFLLKDKKRVMPAKINAAIDFYDSLFSRDDGEALFAALEPFNDFPKGNLTPSDLSQKIFEAAINPYFKIIGERQQKRLVQLMYKALEDLIPHYRSEPFATYASYASVQNSNNIIKDLNQSTVPMRRNVDNSEKVVFLPQHQKLSHVTPRYPRHFSDELQHHHNRRNSRREHQRHPYDYDHPRSSSISSERDKEIEGDASEISVYQDSGYLKARRQKNTHTRQRMRKLKERLDKLKQQLHRQHQIEIKQRQQRRKDVKRRNTKERQDNFNRFKIRSRTEEHSSQYSQHSIENDSHKIREVSSKDHEGF